MKIYTRTGDSGETSLFDGTRVSKSDPRVDAYGEIDELNAVIGLVRSAGVGHDIDDMLLAIQRDLHAVGAILADPGKRIAERVTKASLGDEAAARLEAWINAFDSELPPLRRFVLAGGCQAAATLHLARTVCRRAERRIVSLSAEAQDTAVLTYVNRLSDLLFMLARVANQRAGVPESEW